VALAGRVWRRVAAECVAVFYTYKLDFQDVPRYLAEHSHFPSKYDGFTVQDMTTTDLRDMVAVYEDEIHPQLYEDLAEKLADSLYEAVVVKDKNGGIGGYGFVRRRGSKPAHHTDHVDLETNVYFLRDYVFSKYRGKGLQQYMLYRRLERLLAQGWKTATTYMAKPNFPSRRSYEKFGFRICLKTTRLRLLRRQIVQEVKT
jgi:GNAT superfamily N-acetyltransferase